MIKQIFTGLLISFSLVSCDKDAESIATPIPASPTVTQDATYQVNITEDITYAEGLRHDSLNSSNATIMPLLMDAYVSENDLQNRPLLMLIHEVGFTGGSKQ